MPLRQVKGERRFESVKLGRNEKMIYANNYPLSDDAMKYDYENHRYVLQYDYVKKKTGVDLALLVTSLYVVDKMSAVNNLLSDISEQLYNYVYSYNPRYNDYQEYLMAKSPMARELIKNALLKQLSYTLRNGKLNEFAGVNVSYNQTNAVNLMEDVRGERTIHAEAINYLSRPIEDNEKLLYNGDYYVPYKINYRVGY